MATWASECLSHRKSRHEGLERMNVNAGDTGGRLAGQAVDIPKFSCVRVGVEKIIDAERGAPPFRERVASIEVPFPKSLAIDLTQRHGRRGIGASRSEIVLRGR